MMIRIRRPPNAFAFAAIPLIVVAELVASGKPIANPTSSPCAGRSFTFGANNWSV